mgnify:CR=1 FL=1
MGQGRSACPEAASQAASVNRTRGGTRRAVVPRATPPPPTDVSVSTSVAAAFTSGGA